MLTDRLLDRASGPMDLPPTELAPNLVTPDRLDAIKKWRLIAVGDNPIYFSALGHCIENSEDSSGAMVDMLANPNLNSQGGMLKSVEIGLGDKNTSEFYDSVLTDAISLGQYLTRGEYGEKPQSVIDAAITKNRMLGRLGIMKAIRSTSHKIDKLYEDPVERFQNAFQDEDIEFVFQSLTAVAWQVTDAFEANSAVIAVVKLSGLSQRAKAELGIVSDFRRWSKEFSTINTTPDDDTKIDLRSKFFGEIMDKFSLAAANRNRFREEPIMDEIVALSEQYRSIAEAADTKVSTLSSLIDEYDDKKVLENAPTVATPESNTGATQNSEKIEAEPVIEPKAEDVSKFIEVTDEQTEHVDVNYQDERDQDKPEEVRGPIDAAQEEDFINLPEIETFSPELAGIAQQLEWEVLPPLPTFEEIRAEIEKHYTSEDLVDIDWERIKDLVNIEKTMGGEIYRSKHNSLGTIQPYFVLRFERDDKIYAVAENPQYGNATYILREDLTAGTWKEMLELPKHYARQLGANRLVHSTPELHRERVMRALHSLFTVQ